MRKEEDVVMVERIRDVEVEENINRTGEREMGEKFGGGYENKELRARVSREGLIEKFGEGIEKEKGKDEWN